MPGSADSLSLRSQGGGVGKVTIRHLPLLLGSGGEAIGSVPPAAVATAHPKGAFVSRDRSPKASDVFKESMPFRGTASNFDEAMLGTADLVWRSGRWTGTGAW